MSNTKGGLIQKKKNTLQPPVPVKKSDSDGFGFSNHTNVNPTPTIEVIESKVVEEVVETAAVEMETPTEKTKLNINIGKSNSTKSIKVPTIIHTEINLLGSFMDESKSYAILQKLIESYVEHELTDRQKRQFEFMVDALHNEK